LNFTLAHPGLVGDMLGAGARVHERLMLLAGLILLAACANLGSLFAAEPPIEPRTSRFAWRWVRGARSFCADSSQKPSWFPWRGAIGLAGGVLILHLLSAGSPFRCPINVPSTPTSALTPWRFCSLCSAGSSSA